MSEAEPKPTLADDVNFLSRYEQFARLADWIYEEREIHIKELHEATTDQIQQITGMILECDKMLEMIGYRSLKAKFAQFL